MNLIQITLLQAADYNQSSNSSANIYDVCKDFVLPIVAMIATIWLAFRIFVKETRQNSKRENKIKLERENEKLKFFSSLVKESFTSIEQQLQNMTQNIALTKTDNISFHYLRHIPLNNLKRISESNSIEEFLHSFTSRYRNDPDKVKTFQVIISSIDYFLFQFILIEEQWKKAQHYDFERKMKFKDLYERSINQLGSIMIKNKDRLHEVLDKFYNVKKDFEKKIALTSKYDLTCHCENFLIPINKICQDNIELMPAIYDLGMLTRDAIATFKHIKSENDTLKDELIVTHETASKQFEKFKKASENLRKVIDESSIN